jgi:hypothetical protein
MAMRIFMMFSLSAFHRQDTDAIASAIQHQLLRKIVLTDGTKLPIVRSGDFGASPFLGQLWARAMSLTVRGTLR